MQSFYTFLSGLLQAQMILLVNQALFLLIDQVTLRQSI